MIHDSVVPSNIEGSAGVTPLDARLEKFLFAPIGANDEGTQLRVISVLARRGCDPWAEAARLSTLPTANASEALSLLIGNIPQVWCKVPDRHETVSRLLRLLPRAESRVVAPFQLGALDPRRKVALLPVLCILLFAAVLVGYAFR